jgi:outer membrane protein TolC
LLFLLSGSAFAAAPLTLQGAVEYAVAHSPSLDSQRRSAEIAELQRRSAFARFLPSADFSTTNGLAATIPPQVTLTTAPGINESIAVVGTSPWSSQLSLGVTETLYDNGATLTQYHQAQLSQELADVNFKKARAQLALDVSTQFYTLSLNRQIFEAKKEQTDLLRKQFDSVSSQYRQGMKTRQDFLRFEAQLRRAETDLLSARDAIQSSEFELRRLLGVAPDMPAADLPVFSPLDAGGKAPAAPGAAPPLSATYEARSAELQKGVNSGAVDLSRRKYWPQLNLSGGINYLSSNYLGANPPSPYSETTSWNALATISFNLWDWGIRRRDVEVAEATEVSQADQLNAGLLSVNSSIQNLMADLERHRREYQLGDELLKLQKESFDFLDEQYRLGKITYLDIVTGLNDLLDAQTRYYTAYFGLLQVQAQYGYYEGNLYENLVARQ